MSLQPTQKLEQNTGEASVETGHADKETKEQYLQRMEELGRRFDLPIDTTSTTNQEIPAIQEAAPADNEKSIENNESRVEYFNSVKSFIGTYKDFFYKLAEYNDSTLNNGQESTASILYIQNFQEILSELDGVSNIDSEAALSKAISMLDAVTDFIAQHSFPVDQGMMVASMEGYTYLAESADELNVRLSAFYDKLSDKQREEIQAVALKISNYADDLKRVADQRKLHLNDYMSR
jgi:hypothetical protein